MSVTVQEAAAACGGRFHPSGEYYARPQTTARRRGSCPFVRISTGPPYAVALYRLAA